MKDMVDEFLKGFSALMPEFYNNYADLFKIKSMADWIVNGKTMSMDELVYWYFVQELAKKQVNSFANKLPDEVKTKVDTLIDSVKDK
ncbi:MAG: hypothetical protein LBG72_01980 [Spirochaetaceae bacterium]|jgi:hypothetical protein|nr:hypothetical protein [Spirochaetaceae bacterium]